MRSRPSFRSEDDVLWDDYEGGPMFKDSRGIGGGFAKNKERDEGGSEELEEHGETHAHKQVDRCYFAHTSDLTGPTQPHGELGEESPYLHDGGIELQGKSLINLAHEHTHKGLVHSKRGNLIRGLVLGYNLLGDKS